jgi:hypothetical protein
LTGGSRRTRSTGQMNHWFGGGGAGVVTHCCEDMRREVAHASGRRPGLRDRPDWLIDYSPRFREYGLVVQSGGVSSTPIRFCPWCGSRLPASLRDEWYAELGRRGIDPCGREVPAPFWSSEWWAGQDAEPV